MWFKDASKVVNSFNVERIYLQHDRDQHTQVPDYRHWQIPLGRRFRALKVWITFKSIGAQGLRDHVKKHINLAKYFENLVRNDKRFEVVAKPTLGLVCFRVKGVNRLTENLLHRLNDRKKIFLIQAEHRGKHFLRFCICGMNPKEEDITFAWNEILSQVNLVFEVQEDKSSISLSKEIITNDDFRLMLRNLVVGLREV